MVLTTRPWQYADDPNNPSQLPPRFSCKCRGRGAWPSSTGHSACWCGSRASWRATGLRDLPPAWLASFRGAFPESVTSASVRATQELTWQLARYALRRCLALVRSRGHGGRAGAGRRGRSPGRSGGLAAAQVRGAANNLGTRYLSLLTHVLTRSTELGLSSWEAYRQTTDGRLRALHTEIEHFATLLADLMGVDGALVLSKQFEILGFGVELHVPPLPCTYADGSIQQLHRSVGVWEQGNTTIILQVPTTKKLRKVVLGGTHAPDKNLTNNIFVVN